MREMNLEKGVRINNGKYVELRFRRKDAPAVHEYFGPLSALSVQAANSRSLELQRLLYLGKYQPEVKVDRWSVEKVLDTYMKRHGTKKRTADDFQRTCNYFKAFAKGRMWDTLNHEDFEEYQEERLEEVEGTSVKKELGVLKHVFNIFPQWTELGLVPQFQWTKQVNPITLIDVASTVYDTRVLAVEEFERLLSVAPPHRREIYEAAVKTLLRRKDLRLLSSDHLVFPSHSIKGIQSKTGKPYHIPLTKKMFDGWKERTGLLLNFVNFRRGWEEDRAAANLLDCPFRAIRRTGATWMYKKTGDLKAVSDLLGHTSIKMTEKYIGVESKDKKEAVQAVENLIDSAKDLGVILGVNSAV